VSAAPSARAIASSSPTRPAATSAVSAERRAASSDESDHATAKPPGADARVIVRDGGIEEHA
jgi:hypothetical protein